MTNRELIVELLKTDLDAPVELRKTVGQIEFKPINIATWQKDGQHAVYCSNCNCRVSVRASLDMNYCFKCGSQMEREV